MCAAVVYIVERHYRGPGEEIIYGTWEVPDYPTTEPVYFRFTPDRRFAMGFNAEGEFSGGTMGTWSAGGSYIYLRFAATEHEPPRVQILRIVDITAEAIRVRHSRDGHVSTYRRVRFPSEGI